MNIKTMRKKAGIRQIDLAETLGIHQTTVAKWETGEASPQADKIPELAKVLGCKIDDLFKETA